MQTLEKIPIRGLANKFTDEEFAAFCAANRDYRIERDKHGNIIFMSPVHSDSGFYEGEVFAMLKAWSKKTKLGVAFSSSTGFTLPNRAIRSPYASWVSMNQWQALTEKEKKSFAPVCPDFVVEIRSKTDSLKDLQEKMLEWIENGTQLGWLIDIKSKQTYIYRADGSIEIVKGFDKILTGENVLPGLEFELSNLQLP
ncbi:MAG: Uma2 family endonuclease [Saprospiraceae bacterium]|nr:Uma2 family endonuclease [Saprospiraceae bacterium]